VSTAAQSFAIKSHDPACGNCGYPLVGLHASGRIILWTFGGVTLVCSIQLFRRWRGTSEFGVTCHARLSPEGFGQRDGFGPVEMIPWLNIGDYELIPAGSKRHRLRIASRMPEGDRVSIKFACTEGQAVWLAEAIVRFRRTDDVRRFTS
jgi:hypothetical protein